MTSGCRGVASYLTVAFGGEPAGMVGQVFTRKGLPGRQKVFRWQQDRVVRQYYSTPGGTPVLLKTQNESPPAPTGRPSLTEPPKRQGPKLTQCDVSEGSGQPRTSKHQCPPQLSTDSHHWSRSVSPRFSSGWVSLRETRGAVVASSTVAPSLASPLRSWSRTLRKGSRSWR